MESRKIDKLYGLLEAQNYRQAITQCLSKEYEGMDIVKALLVYAYAANRQGAQALIVAREMIARNITDDHVLATMSQGLRMLRKDTELIPCYENMLATHTFNEAGLLEIFTCYCRAGEHKKMQLISQKLYKATQKPCYMYWSVCCMVQQVITMEGSGNANSDSSTASSSTVGASGGGGLSLGVSNNTMLVLGERMLKKLIYTPTTAASTPTTTGLAVPPGGKSKTAKAVTPAVPGIQQPGAEELQLYLDILMRQGKLTEALQALLELHPSAKSNVATATTLPGAATAPTSAESPLKMLSPSSLNDDRDFKARPSAILLQELVAKELHASLCAGLAKQQQQPAFQHDVRRIYETIVFDEYPDQWDVHVKLIDQLWACAMDGEHEHEAETETEAQQYLSLVCNHLNRLKALQLQKPVAATATAGDGVAADNTAAAAGEAIGSSTSKKSKKKKAGAAATDAAVAGDVTTTTTSTAALTALNTRYRGPFLAEIHLLEVLLENCANTSASSAFLPAGWTPPIDLISRATPRYLAKYNSVMKASSSEMPPPPSYLSLLTNFATATDTTTIAAPRTLFQEKLVCLLQYICVFGEKQCLLSDIYPYLCSLPMNPGYDPVLLAQFLKLVSDIADDLIAKLDTISLETVPASATATATAAAAASKKKKGGKDIKAPLYPTPVVLSPAELNNTERRVLATGLTCMYAKCRQIQYIVSSCVDIMNQSLQQQQDVKPVPVAGSAVKETLKHYSHSLSLTLGGTGGEREVQAGDELLMLTTAQIQDFQQALALQCRDLESGGSTVGSSVAVTNSAHPEHNRYTALCRARYDSSLQWAELLNVGELTSPYNFVFHLERLEVARNSSDVQTAVASFNQCRVKHVQLESMSYMLLPCLLEHAFFTEALTHNRSILHFHDSVSYDTGDQCMKAYQYANYMKCLEMNRFIDLCQSSMQLALARVECASLTVLEKSNYAAMTDYVGDVIGGKLSESQPFMPWKKINSDLHDKNLDYSVLTRLDICSRLRIAESAGKGGNKTRGLQEMDSVERSVRKEGMAQRLHDGQCRLQVLHCLLQMSRDGGSKARTLDEYTALRATCVSYLTQMNSTTTTAAGGVVDTDSVGDSSSLTVRWSQHIDSGYFQFDAALAVAYRHCVLFLLETLFIVRGGAAAGSDSDSALHDAARSLNSSIALLSEFLHVTDNYISRGDKYNPEYGGVKTLAAQYVRSVSGLVRSLVAWFPPLLAQLCRIAPDLCAASSSEEGGSGNGLQEARQTILVFSKFMNTLSASLDADMLELKASDLSEAVASLKTDADGSKPTATAAAAVDTKTVVVSGINKSQQTSCKRMKQIIGNKMQELNEQLMLSV